jgi:hypothetical protein
VSSYSPNPARPSSNTVHPKSAAASADAGPEPTAASLATGP